MGIALHTSLGLDRHLHDILDKAHHFDIVVDGAIQDGLEDVVMEISQDHGGEDIFIRLRKESSMDQIGVLMQNSLELVGFWSSLSDGGHEDLDAFFVVLQPGVHELLNPVLDLLYESFVILEPHVSKFQRQQRPVFVPARPPLVSSPCGRAGG